MPSPSARRPGSDHRQLERHRSAIASSSNARAPCRVPIAELLESQNADPSGLSNAPAEHTGHVASAQSRASHNHIHYTKYTCPRSRPPLSKGIRPSMPSRRYITLQKQACPHAGAYPNTYCSPRLWGLRCSRPFLLEGASCRLRLRRLQPLLGVGVLGSTLLGRGVLPSSDGPWPKRHPCRSNMSVRHGTGNNKNTLRPDWENAL